MVHTRVKSRSTPCYRSARQRCAVNQRNGLAVGIVEEADSPAGWSFFHGGSETRAETNHKVFALLLQPVGRPTLAHMLLDSGDSCQALLHKGVTLTV